MRQIGHYDIEDPGKIQGRDEVHPTDHSLAALRLQHALRAIEGCGGRLLVLGCGAGRYVRALSLARPDLELHGGDLSHLALREAREHDASAYYAALDASTLPYLEGSFGAVVFFDLLEHVPNYQGMLDEIARVLEPGGVLYLFTPLEGKADTLYALLKSSRRVPINRWKRDHVGHVNHFASEDVLQAVWSTGLRVDDVSYGFHVVGQVHDLIDYWQRERSAGGPGALPLSAVHGIARIAFIPTWRLSYLEDRLYTGPLLASGMHLTAHKRSNPGV